MLAKLERKLGVRVGFSVLNSEFEEIRVLSNPTVINVPVEKPCV